MQEPTQVYARHRPEGTVLYRAVQENFETFLADSQKGGESLPLHVHQEVHAYPSVRDSRPRLYPFTVRSL